MKMLIKDDRGMPTPVGVGKFVRHCFNVLFAISSGPERRTQAVWGENSGLGLLSRCAVFPNADVLE